MLGDDGGGGERDDESLSLFFFVAGAVTAGAEAAAAAVRGDGADERDKGSASSFELGGGGRALDPDLALIIVESGAVGLSCPSSLRLVVFLVLLGMIRWKIQWCEEEIHHEFVNTYSALVARNRTSAIRKRTHDDKQKKKIELDVSSTK